MAVKTSGRREARRKAFELLFELEQHPGLTPATILARTYADPDVLGCYCSDEDNEGYALVAAKRSDEESDFELLPRAETSRRFVCELVQAATEHRDALDAELEKYPEDWSFERIATTELTLLRLALAEMVYIGTSYKVVINEILDLAKLYSQEDATRFINGILGAVVRNLPALRESATEETAQTPEAPTP
jgi:transcription antitermination factor NusB